MEEINNFSHLPFAKCVIIENEPRNAEDLLTAIREEEEKIKPAEIKISSIKEEREGRMEMLVKIIKIHSIDLERALDDADAKRTKCNDGIKKKMEKVNKKIEEKKKELETMDSSEDEREADAEALEDAWGPRHD